MLQDSVSGEQSRGAGSLGGLYPEVLGAVWVGHSDGCLSPLRPQWAPQHLEGPWLLARGSQEWRRVVVRSGEGPGWHQGLRPSWSRTHSTAGGSRGWNSSARVPPSDRGSTCPPCRALLHTQNRDRCREDICQPLTGHAPGLPLSLPAAGPSPALAGLTIKLVPRWRNGPPDRRQD